jgi:hypothetical protein
MQRINTKKTRVGVVYTCSLNCGKGGGRDFMIPIDDDIQEKLDEKYFNDYDYVRASPHFMGKGINAGTFEINKGIDKAIQEQAGRDDVRKIKVKTIASSVSQDEI